MMSYDTQIFKKNVFYKSNIINESGLKGYLRAEAPTDRFLNYYMYNFKSN